MALQRLIFKAKARGNKTEANEAQQELDELRAENERLRAEIEDRKWDTGELGCSEDYAALADEWLTHNSHEPPSDLAAAQFVYWTDDKGTSMFFMGYGTVDEAPWHPGLSYRPALSASGLPLCSAEGLEPWATHVATDNDGMVWQYEQQPDLRSVGFWRAKASPAVFAPETHRRPGPASESLMEVHRD